MSHLGEWRSSRKSMIEKKPSDGSSPGRDFAGAKPAAEKVRKKSESGKGQISRARARLIPFALSARLKACTCYKAPTNEFFRSL